MNSDDSVGDYSYLLPSSFLSVANSAIPEQYPPLQMAPIVKPVMERPIPVDSQRIPQFLHDEFTKIKRTHPRKKSLPINWPASSVIEEIIDRSSGQLLYASTVIKYISSSSVDPAVQLTIVNDIRPQSPSADNPLAHLDALYQHIFSQTKDLEKVLDILALIILGKAALSDTINFIEATFRLKSGKVQLYLEPINALLRFDYAKYSESSGKVALDLSLKDFLRDSERSTIYHINPDEYGTKLACLLLEMPAPPFGSYPPPVNTGSSVPWTQEGINQLAEIRGILPLAKPSVQLWHAIMGFDIRFYHIYMDDKAIKVCLGIQKCLCNLVRLQWKTVYFVILILFNRILTTWTS
jgi:hypothetical protein